MKIEELATDAAVALKQDFTVFGFTDGDALDEKIAAVIAEVYRPLVESHAELLDHLDNVAAALDTVLACYECEMHPVDRRQRNKLVVEAHAAIAKATETTTPR